MKFKQFVSALLALALVVCCFCACGKREAPIVQTEAEAPATEPVARGRYVEQEFPLPEGQTALDMVALTTGQLRVALRDGEGNVTLYTTDPQRTAWAETLPLAGEVTASGYLESLALSPEGGTFCSTVEKAGERQYRSHFWYFSPSGEYRELPVTYDELDETAGFLTVASDFTADGRLLAQFYFDQVREINLETGELSENLNELDARLNTFGCAGNAAYLMGTGVSVHRDGVTQAAPVVLREQLLAYLEVVQGYTATIPFWEDRDGYLFFPTNEGLYSYNPGGSVTEELVSGARTSLGDPYFLPLALTGGEDGSFYVLGNQSGYAALYRYVYDENAPIAASTQLRVYSLYEDEDLRQMISQFQRANPDISVDLEVGLTGEDGITEADAIRTLNTEILAGSGPDLLRLDGFDLNTYLEKGLLADLSDVLAQAGPLLEQVTNCYGEDGKVCAVPTAFALPAIYGAEKYVSQIHDLDSLVAAAAQAREENPQWERIVNGIHPAMMADRYYDSCSAAWRNPDGTLDGEKLAAFYAAMKELYALDEEYRQKNAESMAFYASRSYTPGDYTGLGGAAYLFMDISFLPVGTLDSMSGWSIALAGEEEFLGDGYETVFLNGQASNVFLPRRIMGILTTSASPEAAAQFLSFLLGDQAQSACGGFPVNKTVFDREIAEDKTSDMTFGTSDEDGNEINYKGKWPDARRRQELNQWVQALTTPALTNRIIRNMVMDQMGDCLNGKITPQQAAENALRSLNLYLSE